MPCYKQVMMLTDAEKYAIIARKDSAYDGVFFVGVTSTQIFCRPGCPARVPKVENCTFYDRASAALSAGYRACKRCHPSRLVGEASPLVKQLISLVEAAPEQRYSEQDLKRAGIDPSTARRQFKLRFGLTFTQYARLRRLGRAAQDLGKGAPVIDAQLNAGYESASGFRAAFDGAFGAAPKHMAAPALMIDWIDTPFGPMIAICDEAALYLLEFTTRKNLDRQVRRVASKTGRAIVPGHTQITHQITGELIAYFKGELKDFKTPLTLSGTDFQKSVWQALCDIPYGQTRSYAQLAQAIGNAKAVRAVASSNANNGLALIVPCHRVINTGGGLGGYAGGLDVKQRLLDMEAGKTRLF